MTSFTHLLAGGAVGAAAGSWMASAWGGVGVGGTLSTLLTTLGVAALGGFLSHFIFDLIPHNDYLYYFKNNWRIVYLSPLSWFFLLSGGLAVSFLSWNHPQWLGIWTGAFFGLLPDLLTGGGKILGWPATPFDLFHLRVHGRRDLGERLYLKFSRDLLTGKDENGQKWDDFRKIRNSFWGKVGWGVELAVEILVIGVSVWRLLG